jgi:precorrin-6A/cobalt-precorrin-6A reductase
MIWIIGGTINATHICSSLVSAGFPVLISVTTDYGRQLSEVTGVEVIKGMLDDTQMCDLINTRGIKVAVDASHPFAAEVSKNAIKVAKQTNVTYIRFERQNTVYERAMYVSGYPEAVAHLGKTDGNILITTGSKNIHQFTPLGTDRLYARVLSSSESMLQCDKAGLKPSHIIGITGVCSVELNLSLLKEFNIRHIVTKDSGNEGGLREKIEAAQKAGVEVIIIKRPVIHYPNVFTDYNMLFNQIEKLYDK